MKRKKTVLICLVLIFAMLFMTACGSQEPADAGKAEEKQSEPADNGSEEKKPAENTGELVPEKVIEGFDELNKLADDASMMQAKEGMVVKIIGLASFHGTGFSVVLPKPDDPTTKIGIVMVIDDLTDENKSELFEKYQDDTKVAVTGVIQKGEEYQEFHVKMKDIEYLD